MARNASVSRTLHILMVSAVFMNWSGRSVAASGLRAAAPPGFEDLAADRPLILDAYFAGRKIGEVRAVGRPGSLTFNRPDLVAAMIPRAADPAALARLLSGPLPTNVALACGPAGRAGCGRLEAQNVAIIFDEYRFRVDIFLQSDLIERADTGASYLPDPDAEPSMVSILGGSVSGSNRGGRAYHIQNRSIASIGAVRLRSDGSLANDAGWTFDNLSVEADRRDWRFVGGLFWAPGTDLIGRRRVMGVGISTHSDLRLDRDALMATPLPLFLQQPAKVDLVVDGRLHSSRIYPGGNLMIDTASLPNGSYEILIRIQEDGRPVREERQFFTKGTAIAPAGRPLLSLAAGLLPRSGSSTSDPSLFYQATAAYRLGRTWGVDATLIGTSDKAVLEGGAALVTRFAQVRAAGLVSTASDYGMLLRASSVGRGRLAFSLDARKVRSRDGNALLPVTASPGTFSEEPASGFADRGSYSQLLAILGYRLGSAQLRFTGLYRRSGSEPASYSLGMSGEMPVARSGRWDVLLHGDLRETDSGFTSFIGVRLLANRGKLSYSGSAGLSRRSADPDHSTRLVGEGQVAWSHRGDDGGQVSADAALGRDHDQSYGRASAAAKLGAVNARADMLHQFGGGGGTTQYSAAVDTGFVMAGGRLKLASRDLKDSAVLVQVTGTQPEGQFDILVDDVVRGDIRGGTPTAVFLQPYNRYEVRLRPRGDALARFDSSPREVTVLPGSVVNLRWAVEPLVIVFGRALAVDGTPLRNANISSPRGIGQTDAEGYFQVETSVGEDLRFKRAGEEACGWTVAAARPASDYLPVGDIICR